MKINNSNLLEKLLKESEFSFSNKIDRPVFHGNVFRHVKGLYLRNKAEIKRNSNNGFIVENIETEFRSLRKYLLNEVELEAWNILRTYHLPFYPQFPAGKYFIDFFDPVSKIGIEIDGTRWHMDAEKDASRDADLRGLGITLIHIPASAVKVSASEIYKIYHNHSLSDFLDSIEPEWIDDGHFTGLNYSEYYALKVSEKALRLAPYSFEWLALAFNSVSDYWLLDIPAFVKKCGDRISQKREWLKSSESLFF